MYQKLFKLSCICFLSQPVVAFSDSNFVLEANPLLLANQGFGMYSEYKIDDGLSLGADIEGFAQTPYSSNGVTAKRNIYSFAPKLHYYFVDNGMFGPFVGAKVLFTYSQAKIYDSEATANSNVFFVAPVIQVGYRFVAKSGFTLSAYIGAGFKSSNSQFEQSNVPASKNNNSDWKLAQEKLNKHVSQFQPDYGITLGYMF